MRFAAGRVRMPSTASHPSTKSTTSPAPRCPTTRAETATPARSDRGKSLETAYSFH